jgi:hypothetical protein
MWGIGLPEDGRFRALLYNAFAECLIAAFSRSPEPPTVIEELYYRRISSSEYLKIDGLGDKLSLRFPVSSPSSPLIFSNVFSCRPNAAGYDWQSISSFDLVTHQIRRVFEPASIPRFDGCEKAWISSLLSISGDGLSLTVTMGIPLTESADLQSLNYWVCNLRLSDLAITRIAKLATPFA